MRKIPFLFLSLFLALFGLVTMASLVTAANAIASSPTPNQILSDYIENFDVDANWVNVTGSSFTSYSNKAYTDTEFSHITFYAEVALRETSGTQDGFP